LLKDTTEYIESKKGVNLTKGKVCAFFMFSIYSVVNVIKELIYADWCRFIFGWAQMKIKLPSVLIFRSTSVLISEKISRRTE